MPQHFALQHPHRYQLSSLVLVNYWCNPLQRTRTSIANPVAPKKPTGKSSGQPSESPISASASSGRGFKVQVFYLAASSNSPSAPIKDALWFATYPIIPRIGDCVFRDGVYYRVERVFLYENLAAGWCADVEVTFYGRR